MRFQNKFKWIFKRCWALDGLNLRCLYITIIDLLELIRLLKGFRCSTSVLVFCCWLKNHVIYLKMSQKYCSYKLSKLTFFYLKWSGLKKIIILSKNNWHFAIFFCLIFRIRYLSQLEINHVIYEPAAKN